MGKLSYGGGQDVGWITNDKLSDAQLYAMYQNYDAAHENPFQGAFGDQIHEFVSSSRGLAAGINGYSRQLDMAAGVAEATTMVAAPGAEVSVGEGFLSKVISKWFGKGASEAGAGRVFWSGGKEVLKEATKFARSIGGKTLEMTTGGKIMIALDPILPRWASKPIWESLSTNFAKGATGAVDVFHNVNGIRIESVWAQTEYGILKNNNIKMLFHLVTP